MIEVEGQGIDEEKLMSNRVLFVHTPKRKGYYLPFGQYTYINLIPQGMFAIVDLVHRNSFDVRFIHLGLKEILNDNFSFQQYLSDFSPKTIGFSLHWHHQSFDVIEAARLAKQTLPESYVFLGGFTATHFADELMRNYEFIDAVVCGHGDQPTLALLKALEKMEAGTARLDDVPNIVYRTRKGLKRNATTYIHTPEGISELRYANLGLLENHKEYVKTFGYPLHYQLALTRQQNIDRMYNKQPYFPLATGVGCPVTCSNCSANHKNLERLTGSSKIVWRNKNAVIDDIKRAMSYGYRGFIVGFDPAPRTPRYYLALFEEIRRLKLDIDCNFECWGLPTPEFIESFSKTFSSASSEIYLTPETPSERLRTLNRGYSFTNTEFFQTLETIRKFNVNVGLFFAMALPGETVRDALEIKEFVNMLRNKYSDIIGAIFVWPAILEPGSPMFLRPSELGLETAWKTFTDFYKAHRDGNGDSYSSLGYKIANYFGDERDAGGIRDFEREIKKLKCRHFCAMSIVHGDSDAGRFECLARRKKVFASLGLPTDSLRIISEEYDMYAALEDEKAMLAGSNSKRMFKKK